MDAYSGYMNEQDIMPLSAALQSSRTECSCADDEIMKQLLLFGCSSTEATVHWLTTNLFNVYSGSPGGHSMART